MLVAALSVAIAVTLMCTSLSQHCHYHYCHNAVLVFAVTALCTSVFGRCGISREYLAKSVDVDTFAEIGERRCKMRILEL